MRQQNALPVCLKYGRISNWVDAHVLQQVGANKEIPIARHEANPAVLRCLM